MKSEMGNKDGLAKNFEVITDEWAEWLADQQFNLSRFKYVTLPFMDTRVPLSKAAMGFPDNNEFFHLCTAFISSTYRHLPRTLTYLTILGLVAWGIGALI